MYTYKKNDIIRVNINGVITAGIVLENVFIIYRASIGDKYLNIWNNETGGYRISTSRVPFPMGSCYLTLIGDEKVYVEDYEIYDPPHQRRNKS